MATKTITLELDAYEKLKAAKRPGESFSATVRRARFGPSDPTGKTILASMEGLTVRSADLAAVEYWSPGVAEARTTTPSRWSDRRVKLVDTDRVTEQLDAVYATEDSSLDPILAEIQHRMIREEPSR